MMLLMMMMMMMMMMRINSDHVSTSLPYSILESFKWANNCSFWSAFCGEFRYTLLHAVSEEPGSG